MKADAACGEFVDVGRINSGELSRVTRQSFIGLIVSENEKDVGPTGLRWGCGFAFDRVKCDPWQKQHAGKNKRQEYARDWDVFHTDA